MLYSRDMATYLVTISRYKILRTHAAMLKRRRVLEVVKNVVERGVM